VPESLEHRCRRRWLKLSSLKIFLFVESFRFIWLSQFDNQTRHLFLLLIAAPLQAFRLKANYIVQQLCNCFNELAHILNDRSMTYSRVARKLIFLRNFCSAVRRLVKKAGFLDRNASVLLSIAIGCEPPVTVGEL
jgi:hypothetical protein